MNEIIKQNGIDEPDSTGSVNEIMEIQAELLQAAKGTIDSNRSRSIPVAELATLGAGVSSLIPAFNTVTQTTSIATDGLFRIANEAAGDTLKMAKNGNAWGAMKTASGSSKMVQLAKAEPVSATTRTVTAFNPATMMMAVALYSIEKDLTEIAEAQKKILAFLEVENESQIEADVQSLIDIITTYKYKWDNDLAVSNSHNVVMDIQNRARKNIIAYQKKISVITSSRTRVVTKSKVRSALYDLEKEFRYYRLSLYIFSLASFLEIMLSGNFKEEYISGKKEDINSLSIRYREQFKTSSLYLEKLGDFGVEFNIIKGIGIAGETVGKVIGSIPVVRKGLADEFLQSKGAALQQNAIETGDEVIKSFAAMSNPGTCVFIEKMEDMNQIYNHTSQICFDNENIYLIEE